MHLPSNTILQSGKYRIRRFISSGGFGCTYEAEHILLEKRVAIKEFFVKDFCNRNETTAHVTVGTISKQGLVEKLRSKFIEEAKALSKLHHPGIVSVSDVFEENGTAYFVMDYIEGRSLSEILREQGPLPEERAVRYISQVADALQYVHDNNRLHLDLKPGNIMVDHNDWPILIDFGASKQYDELDGENTSTLLGNTPGYTPPEQMSRSVVKFLPATDIYSLGATLYKLLTNITPPDASLRISGENLAPLPDKISAAVQNAVTAAMEINKGKRPQTLSAFVGMLGGNNHSADEDITIVVNDDTKLKGQSKKAPIQADNNQKIIAPFVRKKKWKSIIVYVLLVGLVSASVFFIWRYTDVIYLDDVKYPNSRLYGLKIGKCEILKKYKSAYAASFSEGLSIVKSNGKYGFIDSTGAIILPIKYDLAWGFSEGLAVVLSDGKWEYIDRTGTTQIKLDPPTYPLFSNIWEEVYIDDYTRVLPYPFKENVARIRLCRNSYNRIGYIDKTGKKVIPFIYQGASDFSEGLAAVKFDGRNQISYVLDGDEIAVVKHEDMNDKWGYIDKTGKVIIPFQYLEANPFSNGKARVNLNGQWLYIDKSGNVVE